MFSWLLCHPSRIGLATQLTDDNLINDPQAEARLAAKRQARAEAREIRMRELDRQQKEHEQNADRAYDMQQSDIMSTPRSRLTVNNHNSALRGNSMSSRRSSEDSLEEEGKSLRDLRHELKVGSDVGCLRKFH